MKNKLVKIAIAVIVLVVFALLVEMNANEPEWDCENDFRKEVCIW